MNKEIKSYKLLDTNFPPNPPIKDAKLYVLNQSTQKVETYITDMFGIPKPLKDDTGGGGGGTYTFYSSDNSISISGTNNVNLILESSLKALINSALQSGNNISELNNDENYITLGDIPAFDPSNYDLTEFTNVDADPFVRVSDLVGVGATNLTYTASPTQGTVNSDTGTDAVIPLADGTNAGLITPAEKILVSTALQSGDNISELNNDVGYISSVTGDWTGTFDGQEGSYYLDYSNFTNTPTIPSQLSDLTDVNTSIPTNRNVLVADGVDWESRALTEADISDLQTYLTTEVNDLTASVVWTNVPDANITESSVTQHEAALTITESQISDLSHFTPTDLPTDYGITLGTVATSNDYNDLDNLPSLNSGTVTSVAVSGSDGIEVDSGSPITTSGTIALGLNKTTTLAFLNVEDGADVTDATNVDAAGATMNADTDVSTNSWVLDEDDMSSDSATKVPTQQSVKAYVDNFPTPTENQIKAKRTSATVSGTHNIDPTAFTHHHITMTADTDFTFINVPTNTEDVFKCKLRLTGAFAPSWTQGGLNSFGDAYDGTKWNDVLVEMWLDGTIKGLLIFQQRETA